MRAPKPVPRPSRLSPGGIGPAGACRVDDLADLALRGCVNPQPQTPPVRLTHQIQVMLRRARFAVCGTACRDACARARSSQLDSRGSNGRDSITIGLLETAELPPSNLRRLQNS
jgi:hypothetical protein